MNAKNLTMIFASLLSIAFTSSANATTASDRVAQEVRQLGEEAFVARNYKPGLIRHLVFFRYKSITTPAEKAEIRRRFLALANESERNGKKYILSIEAGLQNSGEGVDQELEEGFMVSFQSEGDRNFYVGKGIVTKEGLFDEAHDRFKNFVGPFLETSTNPIGVVVFDFKVEDKGLPNKK